LKKDKQHIDHLIVRYLSGEATESERLQLEQWQEQSKSNKQYFDQFFFLHEKVLASHKTVSVDVSRGWDSLKRNMSVTKTEIKAKKTEIRFYHLPLVRIAAILILAIGIALSFYKIYISSEKTTVKLVVVESHNKPFSQVLSDNSEVFLNRSSKIIYSSQFGRNNRDIVLSGEAYFNVKHETQKAFIVEAEGTRIKDIGTAFNIKAYPDSNLVKVFVESGEVMFYTKDDPGIKLTRGETGFYNKSSRSFKKVNQEESNILSYKTKVFVFQNSRLSEVIRELNSVYQSNIRLSSSDLLNCKITVRFENEDLDRIVGVIGETLELTVSQTNDGYILEGKGCGSHQ
jgi:transmembrane sensor